MSIKFENAKLRLVCLVAVMVFEGAASNGEAASIVTGDNSRDIPSYLSFPPLPIVEQTVHDLDLDENAFIIDEETRLMAQFSRPPVLFSPVLLSPSFSPPPFTYSFSHSLTNEPVCYDGALLNGKFALVLPDGAEYNGRWGGGNFIEGTVTYANGDVYEGCFANGRPHGWGKYTFANKSYSEGQWKNGVFVKARANGYIHYGSDGALLNGEFALVLPNGNKYDGEWKDGKFMKGTVIYANGGVYEGYFAYGKRNGWGRYTFADESRFFEGEWKSDEPILENPSPVPGSFYSLLLHSLE
ncbi:MAG: hypothetical protein LBG13_02055 [Holosporales bacterium]|jgi:hypothetical protein|nr:hypothetical protein [Holosporales bacterium]